VQRPTFIGSRIIRDVPLDEVRAKIDWSPFFGLWQVRGRYPHRGYPKVFDDPVVGAQARELFKDANDLLDRIIRDKSLRAVAAVGFYPANAAGDDIHVWLTDEDRDAGKPPARILHGLRQQAAGPDRPPFLCISDYVAPAGSGKDYIGMFVLTGGFGTDELCASFPEDDDYNRIMVKALADRLAEAYAEYLHEQIRRELWGYAPDEACDAAAELRQEYQGIRPAIGYPSQPDHSELVSVWELTGAAETGMEYTESYTMSPAASVSALVFGNARSKYFAVGRLGRDQVESYAARKGLPVEAVEKLLSQNLGYD